MFEVLEGVLLILAGDKTCKQTCSDSVTDLSNDVPADKTKKGIHYSHWFKVDSLTLGMLI